MTVKNLEKNKDLIFLCDSQDVKFVKDYIGIEAEDFDSFFVKIEDGDYTEIFRIFGIVPYLEKEIFQII